MGSKILIVDDEANVLRMLGYALEAQGYTVFTAKNGDDALKKMFAGGERPDLVILDINLPDISGLEICTRLRSTPATADLPIIMLTARAQVADKIKGLQVGADEYVTKPFDTDEMAARVAALLERTRRLRQVESRERGKVMGFIGAKGGVGTTTVALNVAAALSTKKKSVVVVELRPFFGTCSLELGQTPPDHLGTLLDLAPERIDERELRNRLVKLQSGLRVLFGPQKKDGRRAIAPGQAEAVVTGLANMVDYTIVDLPCDFSDATSAAIQQCDFVTLVVERERPCLALGKATLDLLASWEVRRGAVGAVIVNRMASPVLAKVAEIRLELGCEVLGAVPAAEEACMTAQRLNMPIVLAQADSAAAIALRNIARAIAERCQRGAKKVVDSRCVRWQRFTQRADRNTEHEGVCHWPRDPLKR